MALPSLKTTELTYQEACEFFEYKENEIKFQQKIIEFEKALSQTVKEDSEKEFNRSLTGEIEGTVTHNFADGQYIRTIVMPKGLVVTTKIHNQNHPFFIMTGEVSIFSEQGVQQIKAPYHGITKRGTKRALYVHEECIFITVHCTDKLNLKEIEEECIVKNFSKVDKAPINIKQIDKLIQQVRKK
jgi:hypothetical protein|tara:strand:- start:591 stop:1145 length:555 start_codon:yes stop_codon:yes gene_type:complete